MKTLSMTAAVLALALAASASRAAPNPDAFKGVTRGRMHDVDTGVGTVGSFSGQACVTHFKLVSGKGRTPFFIDWAMVREVRLTTESSFENGADAQIYKTEPGVLIEGNDQAVHFTASGKAYTANSFEFFTGSRAAAETALAQLQTVKAKCAVLGE